MAAATRGGLSGHSRWSGRRGPRCWGLSSIPAQAEALPHSSLATVGRGRVSILPHPLHTALGAWHWILQHASEL